MKKIYIVILSAILFFAQSLKAQENVALFFSNQPQSISFNPAFNANYRIFITPPIAGKMHIGLNTSGFAWNDLINQSPVYPDSLRIDVNGFLGKLKKSNNLSLTASFDILGVGFKIGKNYFSIGESLNIESKLSFSKSFFDFLVHGTGMASNNVDILDRDILALSAYLTTYIGYAREITDELTVGARLKMYNGIANVHTNKSIVNCRFDENAIEAYGDFDIDMSLAMGYLAPVNSMVNDGDFKFETYDNVSDYVSNVMNNRGFGVDVGATYRYNDMQFSVSVVDFGSIKWKKGNKIKSRNPGQKINFSGIDTDYDNIGGAFDEYFNDMADSLKDAFDLEITDIASYTTGVPTKIYVGYTWEFFPHMQLQALYSGRIINSSYENALTLSYAYSCGPLQLAVGNTFKYKFFNPTVYVGLGGFYIGASVASSYNLAKTSGMNLYLGCNFLLRDKKTSKTNVEPQSEDVSQRLSFLER